MNTSARDEARYLNQVIDRALLEPTPAHQRETQALARDRDAQRLAERIRRRATWLGRHERGSTQQILAIRDELIMSLYAGLAPEGWASAWCDGSSIKRASTLRAGIGVVLMGPTGECIARISRYVGENSAFEAEVAALVAALETASEHHVERIRLHSDSRALVQLWQEKRKDRRLDPVHALVSRFKRIDIRAIPRLHNQAANALAKQAASHNPST